MVNHLSLAISARPYLNVLTVIALSSVMASPAVAAEPDTDTRSGDTPAAAATDSTIDDDHGVVNSIEVVAGFALRGPLRYPA